MSRIVTLAGYGVLMGAALAVELVARRSSRFPAFADAVAALLRRRPARILVQAAWLWLGWHLFVRVHWR